MASESTPGPWVANPGAHGAQWKVCYSSDFGGVIGEVYAGSGQPVEANARLIAAAPTMKEALEEVCYGLEAFMERFGDQSSRLAGLHGIVMKALAAVEGQR